MVMMSDDDDDDEEDDDDDDDGVEAGLSHSIIMIGEQVQSHALS